jgi:hypothetical protein
MLGFFKSASFVDPQLGELHRSRGAWRGMLKVDAEAPVPLVLSGGRAAPDAEALRIAQSVPSDYASWRPAIERELFDHYSPYAEAVAAGMSPFGRGPSTPLSVQVYDLAFIGNSLGVFSLSRSVIGSGMKKHTCARFRSGQLLELCGSVSARQRAQQPTLTLIELFLLNPRIRVSRFVAGVRMRWAPNPADKIAISIVE